MVKEFKSDDSLVLLCQLLGERGEDGAQKRTAGEFKIVTVEKI